VPAAAASALAAALVRLLQTSTADLATRVALAVQALASSATPQQTHARGTGAGAEAHWQQLLVQAGVHVPLLDTAAASASALLLSPRWEPPSDDAVLLLRGSSPQPANAPGRTERRLPAAALASAELATRCWQALHALLAPSGAPTSSHSFPVAESLRRSTLFAKGADGGHVPACNWLSLALLLLLERGGGRHTHVDEHMMLAIARTVHAVLLLEARSDSAGMCLATDTARKTIEWRDRVAVEGSDSVTARRPLVTKTLVAAHEFTSAVGLTLIAALSRLPEIREKLLDHHALHLVRAILHRELESQRRVWRYNAEVLEAALRAFVELRPAERSLRAEAASEGYPAGHLRRWSR
jgi:hypothetical protein